jgi:glucose-1-phosphate thymidylyltransferase
MNIVIPMAGMGKRMRPHTLSTPKPLLPIAGKPVVQRLVEDIAKICESKIEQIAFVISRSFGAEAETNLHKIAESVGAKAVICYQDQPLGTAHAILCGQEVLHGPVTVAYADTLFRADFKINPEDDGSIWVKKVQNPEAYGVIKQDPTGRITAFIEKPEKFVSDLAIIGIYYFKDGENLRNELQYLIDNNIRVGNEYYINNALDNMNAKGKIFKPALVEEWLDCGNVPITIKTNARYLDFLAADELIHESAQIKNSAIIPPVFIGKNVIIENSIVGPHVSLGEGTQLTEVIIKNSIILENTNISKSQLEDSMIGKHVKVISKQKQLNLGDYNEISL